MTSDGALSVEDLGSTNGVFINRNRQKSGALEAGDHVVFGVLDYLVEEAPEVHAFETLDSTIYRSLKVEDPQRHVGTAAIEGLLATSARPFPNKPDKAIGTGILDAAASVARAKTFGQPVTGIPLVNGVATSLPPLAAAQSVVYKVTVPAGRLSSEMV